MKIRILFFSLLLLAACGDGSGTIADGRWRAVVTLPGGELPLSVDIAHGADGTLHATLVNGAERVDVPQVDYDGNRLSLRFPAFNNRIDLEPTADGFAGTLTLVKRGGELQVMPVTLSQGQSHRFFASTRQADADFGGRWAVTFMDDEGVQTEAVGEFAQDENAVTGTFRTPTGDYRYLAGEVRENELYLSTFDGAHAFLFHAVQGPDGGVQGDFWSGTKWHERFRARRDDNAALPDPNQLSRVRGDVERVEFVFPNTAGEPVHSAAPRYTDKVLIVALAGSWCPNCHDEAAFLSPFYTQYRDQGLEVIGLMFEHLDDFDEAALQVDRFRDKFGIAYELLVVGGSDKTLATDSLGLLDKVIAYPTMIVVDRDGVVRRVHTGFNGPGTGSHYEEFRSEFTAFIEQLLTERES